MSTTVLFWGVRCEDAYAVADSADGLGYALVVDETERAVGVLYARDSGGLAEGVGVLSYPVPAGDVAGVLPRERDAARAEWESVARDLLARGIHLPPGGPVLARARTL